VEKRAVQFCCRENRVGLVGDVANPDEQQPLIDDDLNNLEEKNNLQMEESSREHLRRSELIRVE
jgi:hypothetical protein